MPNGYCVFEGENLQTTVIKEQQLGCFSACPHPPLLLPSGVNARIPEQDSVPHLALHMRLPICHDNRLDRQISSPNVSVNCFHISGKSTRIRMDRTITTTKNMSPYLQQTTEEGGKRGRENLETVFGEKMGVVVCVESSRGRGHWSLQWG